jgi:hypothetical protein
MASRYKERISNIEQGMMNVEDEKPEARGQETDARRKEQRTRNFEAVRYLKLSATRKGQTEIRVSCADFMIRHSVFGIRYSLLVLVPGSCQEVSG